MGFVVGTAGHVDHGKSTLVHALTGIDPDRLREEKERGLTIELGFAWLTLPSGREVSIVDVPGHERFIKNMLAGAGGVDLALLVVAADEGPMPQTREHLAILELLDVPAGIVVLTKVDLVDRDYVELVEAELDDALKATRFARAPWVRVSAQAGDGLEDLLSALDGALDATLPKRDLGRARLPIDRAFTVQGFGLVVTGTLLDGALEVGDEVALQPGRKMGRVRGLQRHRTKVGRLEPGTRAAVNVSGLRLEDVERGMVLARPGTLAGATVLDVHLQAPPILSHPLAHGAGITVLAGTAEAQARLRLLGCEALLPGQSGWAQLVLESPMAVRPGDHCIVRTSNETAAGGRIVAVDSRRHRRNHSPTLARLQRQLDGTPADRLFDLLLQGPVVSAELAARLGIEPAAGRAVLEQLIAGGLVFEREGRVVASAWLASASGRLAEAVRQYLEANALRRAAPREHIRAAVRLPAQDFELVTEAAVAAGRLEERGAGLAPPRYEVRLNARQQSAVDGFLAALKAGGMSPPTEGLPPPALLAYLAEAGLVVDTGAGVCFDPEVYAGMRDTVVVAIRERGAITLAEVRDLLGTSRKYVQALLEHMDATKVTRREGDRRVLR